jgi:type II secretory pathway component GspD/PulD (secretin)
LGPSDTVFDRLRFGRGVPVLPGSNLFTPNVLTELGTIAGDIQVDLLISALKAFTKVDVVNAPNVAVLSGHTATITAGTEVPTFELNIYGANTVVTTKFKKIGVTLDVLPVLTRPDTIRMAVQVKVENITGGVTTSGGGTSATNPIVASRTMTTTMDIRDGSTVILGGLISTGRTGVEDKIPVLGEIPILDVFFTNRHRQDTRSNLIFFLRPKVITQSGQTSPTLIVPPAEGEGERRPEEETPPESKDKEGR